MGEAEMLRCRFSMILAAVVLASGIATAQDAAEWPNTGRDLYTQCASPNRALAHACAEFLLGLMYGAIGTLSVKDQIFCPPQKLSFLQMETLYLTWAKVNPELLDHQAPWAASAALSAAFPCPK